MGVLLNIARLVLSIVGGATGSRGVALALSIVGAVAAFRGGGAQQPDPQDPLNAVQAPPAQPPAAAQPLPVRNAIVVPPVAREAQPVRFIPADTDRLP